MLTKDTLVIPFDSEEIDDQSLIDLRIELEALQEDIKVSLIPSLAGQEGLLIQGSDIRLNLEDQIKFKVNSFLIQKNVVKSTEETTEQKVELLEKKLNVLVEILKYKHIL